MFQIRIETDNAAFEDGNGELCRILRDIADRVESDDIAPAYNRNDHPVFDVNGNKIGSYFWQL